VGRVTAAGTYLGIDIGGTKVAFRVETDAGEGREFSFTWPRRHGAGKDFALLAEQVRDARRACGADFAAVGIALPATVGARGRVVAWPNRPEWVGLDLGARLSELFADTPIAWADDGALGALAEARAARRENMLYLGVGTGVGGGLVLGGALCPPPGRGACEIGHTIVRYDGGEECVCGRGGCLQATASGPATLRRASQLRGGAPVAFDELRDGVRGGREWAVAAVAESCRALAAAMISVGEIVPCDQVVIGGGFAAGIAGFVENVAAEAVRLARDGFTPAPVRPAVWGDLSSLRGAVLLARSTV
jgi:kanosamine 6-kinase